MKPPLKNSSILITGASSGMGKVLGQELAKEAKILILVARRIDKLELLAAELRSKYSELSIYVFACDLSDISATKSLCNQIKRDIGAIDILINNAGSGQIAFLESASFEEIQQMVQLNILALTYLTRAFLPSMIERGKGGILNFSSFFGLKILPGYAAYAGSKHYVSGFTEALRAETAGTGVVVSGVYPGPVRSAFWHVPNADTLSPPSFIFIPVEKCVRGALRGFRKGSARIIPSLRMKFFLAFLALSPAPVERLINAGMARMIRSKQKHLATNPDIA